MIIIFGHLLIEKYCSRQRDWANTAIDNWNRIINKEDKILYLGDFALGPRDDTIFYRNLLNGIIYLLKGNHDRQSRKFYTEMCNFIMIEGRSINYKNLIFTHRPPIILKKDFIYIHGHSHQNMPSSGNRLNVSVEQLNYTPIRLSKLLEKYNLKINGK